MTGSIARPTFQTAQTFPALIRQLGFKPRRKNSKRPSRATQNEQVQEGLQATFLTSKGVFQRISSSVVKAVYVFLKHARLTPRLGFEKTARETINRTFPREADREIQKAIDYTLNHKV